MEWLVLLFIAAGGVAAFFLGTKLLPLTESEER
jgi:hypothetical protein